jgi:hypothetical protein
MSEQPSVRPLPHLPRSATAMQAAGAIAAPSPMWFPVPTAAGFVYAVGRLHARFSTLGVEREYAHVADADPDAAVRTRQLKRVLSAPEHRYLARHMCWVFSGRSADSCTVTPRDDNDLVQLIDLLESEEDQVVQALVGSPATGVPPTPCLGAGLPAVWPEQLLSFTMDEFISRMPGLEQGGQASDNLALRSAVVGDAFAQLTQRADNRGLSDEHRALNYLALRFPPIYHLAAQARSDGKALIGVDTRSSRSGDRRLVAIRLIFRHPKTQLTERYHCPVDVTDVFPFLTGPLERTYD